MMLAKLCSEDEFFNKEKYKKISRNDYYKTGLDWEALSEIYDDFLKKEKDYHKIVCEILEELNKIKNINYLKYRIKNAESLIGKIIRKSIRTNKKITLENYEKEVTDLIGFRVIHLFKEEWREIHEEIEKKWEFKEKPIINERVGDIDFYTDTDFLEMVKKPHPRGYRSIHYLIKKNFNNKEYLFEIQVRTIFEEAWSEIDHKIIYQNKTENEGLNKYSNIINRLSGAADEMANFMANEAKNLSKIEILKDENEKLKKEIEKLKALKK